MRDAIALLAALSLLTACDRDDRGASTASTASPAATSTAVPTLGAAAPTAMLVAPPVIDATNAGRLREVASYAGSGVQRLVWSDRGALWLVGWRTVDEVDPSTGRATRVLEVREPESILAMSPAGVVAVATAPGAQVRLTTIDNRPPIGLLEAGGATRAATFFGGNRLALSAADRISVSIWDLTSLAKVGELTGFETAAPFYNVAISNDGARAAWFVRATLQFSDVATNTVGARLSFEDFIGAWAFAPDGSTFATSMPAVVGGRVEGRVQLWDPRTGLEVLRIAAPEPPTTLAYSTVRPLLVTGGTGFALWSTTDGKRIDVPAGATAGPVFLAAFSPDGTTLATVSQDAVEGALRLWRADR